jgi:hypothetical protein
MSIGVVASDGTAMYYPARIDNVASTFCTSTFRVQYCEQLITLNESCLFRLELPALKVLPALTLLIIMDMS